MKKAGIYYLLVFVSFLFSCKDSKNADLKQTIQNDSIVPISIENTKVNISSIKVPAQTPIINKAKNAVPSPSNSNIFKLGEGTKVIAGNPKINELKKPSVFPAKNEKKLASLPQIVQALPFRTREINPQNIKFLDVEQGLKNSLIYSIIEDTKGGIWIGSKMGITKYDGKFLSTYTEKEGLVSNNVSSLLQDKKGNIWIGSRGSGLSMFDGKYFYNYKSDSLLINNSILSIYQDKKGLYG